MSSHDPFSRPERRRSGALVVTAIAFAAFGFALGNVTRFPLGQRYLPVHLQPPNVTPSLLWLLFASIFVGVVAMAAAQRALRRSSSGVASVLGVTSAVPLIATAVGFVAGAATYWTPPEGGTSSLSGGATLAWTSQWWVPGVLTLLGLVVLVWSRGQAVRTRAVSAARSETARSGLRAEGMITSAADTGVEVMGEHRIRYVVRFRDRAGVERAVTRTELFNPAATPRAGDAVVVSYDPSAPGDEERTAIHPVTDHLGRSVPRD